MGSVAALVALIMLVGSGIAIIIGLGKMKREKRKTVEIGSDIGGKVRIKKSEIYDFMDLLGYAAIGMFIGIILGFFPTCATIIFFDSKMPASAFIVLILSVISGGALFFFHVGPKRRMEMSGILGYAGNNEFSAYQKTLGEKGSEIIITEHIRPHPADTANLSDNEVRVIGTRDEIDKFLFVPNIMEAGCMKIVLDAGNRMYGMLGSGLGEKHIPVLFANPSSMGKDELKTIRERAKGLLHDESGVLFIECGKENHLKRAYKMLKSLDDEAAVSKCTYYLAVDEKALWIYASPFTYLKYGTGIKMVANGDYRYSMTVKLPSACKDEDFIGPYIGENQCIVYPSGENSKPMIDYVYGTHNDADINKNPEAASTIRHGETDSEKPGKETGTRFENIWENIIGHAGRTASHLSVKQKVKEAEKIAECIMENSPGDSVAKAKLEKICKMYLPECEQMVERYGRMYRVSPDSKETMEAGKRLEKAADALVTALMKIRESMVETEGGMLEVDAKVFEEMLENENLGDGRRYSERAKM